MNYYFLDFVDWKFLMKTGLVPIEIAPDSWIGKCSRNESFQIEWWDSSHGYRIPSTVGTHDIGILVSSRIPLKAGFTLIAPLIYNKTTNPNHSKNWLKMHIQKIVFSHSCFFRSFPAFRSFSLLYLVEFLTALLCFFHLCLFIFFLLLFMILINFIFGFFNCSK